MVSCSAKRTTETNGYKSGIAASVAKRKQLAEQRSHLRKTGIIGPLTCPDCGYTRVVQYDRDQPNLGLCNRCSNVRPERLKKSIASGKAIFSKYGPIPGGNIFSSEQVRGSANINWKGGVTPEKKRQRESTQGREWIKAVLVRDDYTCQICRERGGRLHAHHIKTFASHPGLRFDVANGLTACVRCHRFVLHLNNYQNDPLTLEEIRTLQYRLATVQWEAA